MNEEQAAHIAHIVSDFHREAMLKYKRGTEEHEGNLWALDDEELIQEAMNEAVDLYVYLHTLRENMRSNRKTDL